MRGSVQEGGLACRMDEIRKKADDWKLRMKKIALVFAVAVFAPSLALAWLAIRSLSDQQIVFERQQTLLYQGVCSALVKDIDDYLTARQKEFGRQVEALLAERDPQDATSRFDEEILKRWPLAEVGFVVSPDGHVLAPPLLSRPEARRFRMENDLFLSNQESVEIYWPSAKSGAPSSKSETKPDLQTPGDSKVEFKEPGVKDPEKVRKVSPQKDPEADGKLVSSISPTSAEFRQLVGDDSEGIMARFLQNRLKLLVWHRPPGHPGLIFGAQLNLTGLVEGGMRDLVKVPGTFANEIGVALLDDNGRPVAQSHAALNTDWKHPFVSEEIGAALPHWEAAAYLLNPAKLNQSGRMLKLTLGLLVSLLLLAIGVGSWLIVADLNRQLRQARQKTDFVSNVSHELKTPLTSIRMFSELLAEGRVTDEAKQRSYLNIITAEVARLTRLINNVLDFARMERGEKQYHWEQCDLVGLIRETVEAYQPHLETTGFKFHLSVPGKPMFVRGDRDALAQVLVNLLSNAEKYSGEKKEITVVLEASTRSRGFVEICVLDRGVGVPPGCAERIFEQFYRAHDSLSSGIQGSGLGLTLARQIARAHSGDLMYEPRDGGGSCFVLKLPVSLVGQALEPSG
jgi:signal transduction histidine kinase